MKNVLKFFAFALLLILMSCGDDEPEPMPAPIDPARACLEEHPLVGQSGNLRVSSLYGISGTVVILNDCQAEIRDFFYNGLGPAVAIYGARNGDFNNGIGLTDPIQGQRFEGVTLPLNLPDDMTFDDINSFSVWCFEFDVDFSSVVFL